VHVPDGLRGERSTIPAALPLEPGLRLVAVADGDLRPRR
jgi:hypothetical protein